MSNIKPKYYKSAKTSIISSSLVSTNIISTPCEKVLSILREAKNFIFNISKENKLVQKLDWIIKVITSRSLYSYELKNKEKINKLSKENPEFKQLVDFVSEYNEKVIKMNRKYNYILSDKLLQKPSIKLNRFKFERRSSFAKNPNSINLLTLYDSNKQPNKNDKITKNNSPFHILNKNRVLNNVNSNMGNNSNINFKSNINKNILDSSINNKSSKDNETNPFEMNNIKKKISQKKSKKGTIKINDEIKKNKSKDERIENLSFLNNSINFVSQKTDNIHEEDIKKFNLDKKTKNRFTLFPSIQKISITVNNNDNNIFNDNMKRNTYMHTNDILSKKRSASINSESISLNNCENNLKNKKSITNKLIPHLAKDYAFFKLQNKISHEGYNAIKLINDKNFDVFQLKDIIGYNNVLPFAGRTILENLGLIDEEILSTEKLDYFLISVNRQYKQETLYHNSLHGLDVTQSCYIFFSHSNAEKIAKTNVLDLLSIFIAALGHDIGHPGLTNTFHINDSTDMAITYNDISVLENFHAATLFKTIRKTETNIFEKLTTNDYKIIRKRMISEILATDMANHVKVISLIKSKLSLEENGKDFKFNLLTENEQTKNEEKQCLLDFIIHLADLAHNTRIFSISLKWVKLLSEEFWKQGDLEKQLNLPISFLCDRENSNIPQSQKGFISGFIIPTFDCLCNIFPTLKFTLENAKNNLQMWQKLLNEGRIKGWTPPKKKESPPEIKRTITKNCYLKPNNNINFIKLNDNNERKKSKFSKNDSINGNQKKNLSTLNNEITRQSYKKEVKYIKFFKNNDILKKSIKSGKKICNTPIKLRISDDYNLINNQNYHEFLNLTNRKRDKVLTEGNIKKNSNKGVIKKNLNKVKK